MKIIQVTPGIMPIPNNGWGAIEKIIWEYHNSFNKSGNNCKIKYLNDVKDYDIVHIHTANLAIEAASKNIPYIYSLHDHHVFRYGKNSKLYRENLEAIKKSVISFTHAEYLIDFFDEVDKLFYVSHGVNTEVYDVKNIVREEHRLLCVANNGFSDDPSFDRKGFRYAIEGAKKLNLPITIVGPINNKKFFDQNTDLLEYDKLTINYNNPNEIELVKLYETHSIFLHPSMLEAGHPNLTLLEALSCGLPVVGTYIGSKKLNGLYKINPNTDSVIDGLIEVLKNYKTYVNETKKIRDEFNWDRICGKILKIYDSVLKIHKDYNTTTTQNLYLKTFENTEKNIFEKVDENINIILHFIGSPFLEIKSNSNKIFNIQFWVNDILHFADNIKSNMWVKLNRKYHTNWKIKIYDNENIIFNEVINYQNKKVYIHLDSSSLGDTLAWFPMVEEFRKKYNTEVICSTFHNYLFEKTYSDIKFVKPGTVVNNLYAMYKIGWFYNQDNTIDHNQNPFDFRNQHLQKTASDILGLEFTNEIKPKLNFKPSERPIKEKYICIANHSTAQSKYWNNPTGWQEVVDYLKSKGYLVVLLSKEENGYMGNYNPKGIIKIENKNLNEIMNYIHHSEGFIGLGSGLSWLAWSLNKKVFLISGFSRPNCEMQDCVRIFTPDPINTCNGCFNDYKLDPGDWNWCPKHKGTERQFECTKSITGQQVIEEIDKFLTSINQEMVV
jgi:autotransporter strand-loop-strand O-heptosyltransferase